LAMSDVFAVLNAEARAVNDVVALLLAALFIDDGDEAGTIHGNERAAAAFDVFEVHELDDAVVAGFERGTLGNTRGGSTDVERAHGELRPGFTDGLRGDNADGFAKLDHAAGGEVAAIAQRANTAARLASEHGTDAHAVDARGLDGVGQLFVDFLVHVDDDAALEVFDLIERNAAHDAVAERLNFHTRFDDGLDVNPIGGAGVGHDIDRVDAAFLVLALERLEHFIGNFFGDVAPDSDDFVVAFAVGDRAVEVLLLDLDALFFGGVDKLVLVARNKHVVDADG